MPVAKTNDEQTDLADLIERWDSYTNAEKRALILKVLANRDRYLKLTTEAQSIVNYEVLNFLVNQVLP